MSNDDTGSGAGILLGILGLTFLAYALSKKRCVYCQQEMPSWSKRCAFCGGINP